MIQRIWLGLALGIGTKMALVAQGVGGGLSIGINASQIDGDRYGGYNKIGMNLGGFAWYSFSDRVALQPEILFSQRGARQVDETTSYNLRMSYVDFPVILGVQVLGDRDRGIQADGGLSAGYLLGARVGFPGASGVATQFFRRWDLGAHLGAEAFIFPHAAFFFRWAVSLNNQNIYPRPWMNHRYISLGFRFFGKR